MPYENLQSLKVSVADRVATVVIDNPPINLVDPRFVGDLLNFTAEVRDDDAVGAVVFESADPDFFLAHYDMASRAAPSSSLADAELGPVQSAYVALSGLPQVTIAKIKGRARGAGAEFLWACDLRFAARGAAILGQPEVGASLLPGAGGTQRLPLLIGRARALEVILTGEDFDADRAEFYGLVNRALDKDELDGFVAKLAQRVSHFPLAAVRAAKQSVDRASGTSRPNLVAEGGAFRERLADPETARRIGVFLSRGGQTRVAPELNLGDFVSELS
jgi:enoyl-CoA hydratase/carnithine racemase